jgi:hypothetical protein
MTLEAFERRLNVSTPVPPKDKMMEDLEQIELNARVKI